MNLIRLFENSPSVKNFSAGETIFNAGEQGDCLYVVLSGQVDLRIGNVSVETVGPGGLFGEMALVDSSVERSASAIAQAPSKLALVDKRRFEYMVGQTPFFALEVMRVMADRLRKTNRRLG